MRTITQREFRNGSAAVMDAVERGETSALRSAVYLMIAATAAAFDRPLYTRIPHDFNRFVRTSDTGLT